jgi:hypothetical protein
MTRHDLRARYRADRERVRRVANASARMTKRRRRSALMIAVICGVAVAIVELLLGRWALM